MRRVAVLKSYGRFLRLNFFRGRLLSCLVSAVFATALFAATPVPSSSLESTSKTPVLTSIGISVSDLGNPYFVKLIDATAAKAKELAGGPVKMLIHSDAYDLDRQIKQVNEFIKAGVDLIILTAADPYKIAPVVAKAQRAGIKVIAVDVNAQGADATITTDNVQAGMEACERLAKQIHYKGNFVIINGVLVSSVVERVAGCKSVLSKYPNISLLSYRMNGSGSVDGGMEVMTYLMEKYPHLDAVFAINDPTALGALRAAQQAGRKDFIIASVDGAKFAEKMIHQDNQWVATAVQRPKEMADKAVEIGLALLEGRPVPQRFIQIPSVLVEKPLPKTQ
ncbi:D-ribose-binding periplasmic protein precursor [Marinomonas spartinae]|uniref:D-ribose-binding periplasmic protein n=1 Tax=Marinomonas spartinae TaxID=1792290 RepID=A0A1A8TT95_9GAMM|nr:substrate-binding domain-containing protein [Marinomonas spartinae]SBS37632.1 D-ribose-binding periplasmic protein precursor [Marinomonas spartinae]